MSGFLKRVPRPPWGPRAETEAKSRYFYWWAGGHKRWEPFEGRHGSWKFENPCSKWYWEVLLAHPAIRGEQPGKSSSNSQKHVQLLVQLNISAKCGLLAKQYKVIICGFVENYGKPMLLSLQIMAMLTWKEMSCIKNLQIAYCVNCLNTNIPGYCCQRSVFCDSYLNTRYFLL